MRQLRFSAPLSVIGIAGLIISPIFSAVSIQSPRLFADAPNGWRELGVVFPVVNPVVRPSGRIGYVPVNISGNVSVTTEYEAGVYTYRYELVNTGDRYISSFGIEGDAPFERVFDGLGTYSQFGYLWWQFSNQTNPHTQFVDISDGERSGRVPFREFGLKPGETVSVWVSSKAPPGYVNFAVRGNGWLVDLSRNQMASAPQDFGYTGLVIGPNSAVTRLSAVAFLNYILTQPGFARLNGWITAQHEQDLSATLAPLKDSVGSPRHITACDEVMRAVRNDQSELGRMIQLNVGYYRDRFLISKDN